MSCLLVTIIVKPNRSLEVLFVYLLPVLSSKGTFGGTVFSTGYPKIGLNTPCKALIYPTEETAPSAKISPQSQHKGVHLNYSPCRRYCGKSIQYLFCIFLKVVYF